MWEAYDLENEDFLWTGIPFLGGIGGFQNAPCGVVSAAAVCLGLRHRCPLADKERAHQARQAVRAFFGEDCHGIQCAIRGYYLPGAHRHGLFQTRGIQEVSGLGHLERQVRKICGVYG